MSLFTPVQGLIGGSLIGGSAGILLVLNGDIMGCSGILNNTVVNPVESLKSPKQYWRWVYLASFAVGANVVVHYSLISASTTTRDERLKDHDVPNPSKLAYALGGCLVGIGTRLGNGCTTGHGICGISRFSKRSIVGTCTFLGVAIQTRWLISPLRSWASSTALLRSPNDSTTTTESSSLVPLYGGLAMAVAVLTAMIAPALNAKQNVSESNKDEAENNAKKSIGAAISGFMFAIGLAISGMVKKSKVHDFICLSGFSNKTFDPTLMAVMGSGILSSWLSYQFVDGWSWFPKLARTCPLNLKKKGTAGFSVPTNKVIDSQLLTGTAIFGVGWGLTGICPGPGIFAAAVGHSNELFLWLPSYIIGSYTAMKVKEKWDKQQQKKA